MGVEIQTILGTSTADSILVSERMTLGELLNGVEVVQLTPASHDLNGHKISSLAYDSRRASPDCAFFALPGVKTDGNLFVSQAVSRGATAVVSEQPRPVDVAESVTWIEVRAARKALALAAGNFYGRPSQVLDLVGVTGTNGKTTTAFLIDSILTAAGRCAGLFGTVLYRTPGRAAPASNTTPESLELARLLSELRQEGGTAAVLEVSSHALAMDRVWGFRFAAAVFTNLTRDHLDFHETMEGYFAAKRRLFEGTGAGAPAVGVVNIDDPHGRQLVGLCPRTLTYGMSEGADVRASGYRLSVEGSAFTANTPAGDVELRSRLVGGFNVSNLLAATATAVALGIDRKAIAEGIARMESVPGRFERVQAGQPFLVVVDYAHTDDALARLVETARELSMPGRILLLFGAGGDRDRSKRPMMGEAAGRGADLVMVTSDNPRSEDPLAILKDILPGVERTGTPYRVVPDRAQAIGEILAEARSGDAVLIAGKGHETYQVLKDRTIPFDDRLVAGQALRALGYKPKSGGETDKTK